MVEHGVGCVLVSEGGELFGIFSERDVLMRVADRPDELADKPVRDFMTPAPETLTHDAPIAFAVNRMAVGDYRHVPVIEADGKRAGVVSVRDVIAYLCRRYPEIMGTTKPVS
jgi:CBS domain-containing protein